MSLFAIVEGPSPSQFRAPAPAIVALGCRLHVATARAEAAQFVLRGAALRRADAAVAAYFACVAGDPARDAPIVVVSGGRAWGGLVEADAMAAHIVAHGVPAAQVVRERTSHSTRENARYAGALLRRHGIREVTLVTCAFHMARAQRMFELQGFVVAPAPSASAPCSPWRAAVRWGKERGAEWLDVRLVTREPS